MLGIYIIEVLSISLGSRVGRLSQESFLKEVKLSGTWGITRSYPCQAG